MIIPDVNLLLYSINEHYPEHDGARRWWIDVLRHREVGMPLVVQLGFLRIGSNDRIFNPPASVVLLMERIDLWMGLPNVRAIQPGPRHFDILHKLVEAQDDSYPGSRVTDYHLAALAIEHGATLFTHDREFDRFAGLRWRDPLDADSDPS